MKTMCKPVSIPMDPDLKLGVALDKEMYQRLVRRLIYLSHTIPDIAYVVSMVSRFMHCLKEIHLQAAHKILQYLKETLERGIFFKRNGNTTLEASTDVDYAGQLLIGDPLQGIAPFDGRN